MNENEYGFKTIRLTDENGNECVFEEIDRMATDTGEYIALVALPDDSDEEQSDELIILKIEDEKGDISFHAIEDDEEYETIGQIFLDRIDELFDFDE